MTKRKWLFGVAALALIGIALLIRGLWTSDGAAARRLCEAASSAVAKRSDCRMVVLTTAGSPDHFSFKVLEHARSASGPLSDPAPTSYNATATRAIVPLSTDGTSS